MMKFLLAKVLLLTAGTTVLQSVEGAPLNDLIVELPGYGQTPTPQFSGYLNGIKGCDVTKNGPICKIHYWLALADDDTNEQPNDGEEEDTASTKSITAKPTGTAWHGRIPSCCDDGCCQLQLSCSVTVRAWMVVTNNHRLLLLFFFFSPILFFVSHRIHVFL